ncbi:hypothetical protein [Shouchella clausii]|uniref:hypothetical protein n=1 Tax=Shouchella clausii TaxID=79880 RepID=UPI001FEAA498|nr:hypothetical protein [Shouchella clausii]
MLTAALRVLSSNPISIHLLLEADVLNKCIEKAAFLVIVNQTILFIFAKYTILNNNKLFVIQALNQGKISISRVRGRVMDNPFLIFQC